MALLVCIDGSGPWLDDVYAGEFMHSFVRKIWWNSTPIAADHKLYRRGPATDGTLTSELIDEGYRFITDRLPREGENPTIYLAGYSRGAAAVVSIAQRLDHHGHGVEAMILFDCVDRTIDEDCDSSWVPDSVRNLVHARRDIERSRSRLSFGRSATHVRVAPERYHVHDFRGTHGAIGGVPWRGPSGSHYIDEGYPEPSWTTITFDRDLECSREVFWWVMPFVRAYGIFDANSHPLAP